MPGIPAAERKEAAADKRTNVSTASGRTNVPTASVSTASGRTNVPTASVCTASGRTNVSTASGSAEAPLVAPAANEEEDEEAAEEVEEEEEEVEALAGGHLPQTSAQFPSLLA